jgi:hypothetical protein
MNPKKAKLLETLDESSRVHRIWKASIVGRVSEPGMSPFRQKDQSAGLGRWSASECPLGTELTYRRRLSRHVRGKYTG